MLAAACHTRVKPVQDLRGLEDFSAYTLTQVRGHRDGDIVTARAGFSDGQHTLLVDLKFIIDAPVRLQSGEWKWAGDAGAVVAKSIDFLGGQNGPPSVGGMYDLLDGSGRAMFRVTIPTTELEDRTPLLHPQAAN